MLQNIEMALISHGHRVILFFLHKRKNRKRQHSRERQGADCAKLFRRVLMRKEFYWRDVMLKCM